MAIIQRAQDPEDGDETCDCVKCRIKAGLTAKAQALARRDPVGLLLELKNSPSTFKPCLCAFAGALYEQLLDDAWLKRAEMSGPERDRLRQLLDAGLVPHLHALILSEFISHHQLLGVVAVALANLALLVRNKAWWHRRPVVGQLRALVKPLIALIEAKPLTFFDPKHDDDRVEMIVAALGYLHEPPYAMSSSTPTDGLIRVLISAVMRVPDGPGKALDVLQGIARVNEARCWQALPAQASSWSSIGREEVVGYIARTVKSLAAAAAADDAQSSEVDASDVIRVVSLWAYVVPPDDAIAATLLIDNDCGTALTDLLNALVVAHARVGADAGEACAAFGPVLGVFAQIWTRTPASSTIDDDLEALAIGLLPSLELIFAIAQHSCSCNPERRRNSLHGAIECLNALAQLAKRRPRVMSAVRGRVDVLLAPILRLDRERRQHKHYCHHLLGALRSLGAILGLHSRRRCANLDCEVSDGPDEDDRAALQKCGRCKSIFACVCAMCGAALTRQVLAGVHASVRGPRVSGLADELSAFARHKKACVFLGVCPPLPASAANGANACG